VVQELAAEKVAKPAIIEAEIKFKAFQEERRCELEAQEQVSWYLDHFRDLSLDDVAKLIGVTPPLVSRYAKLRNEQRRFHKSGWPDNPVGDDPDSQGAAGKVGDALPPALPTEERPTRSASRLCSSSP
jgi:hypothetical protein